MSELFEPKPHHFAKGVFKQFFKATVLEPKPDEGRLLKPKDRSVYLDLSFGTYQIDITNKLKAQDAKTASIIRAECQERVKGILGFIEQYKEPHEHMGVIDFVGVPFDEWHALKGGVK